MNSVKDEYGSIWAVNILSRYPELEVLQSQNWSKINLFKVY